MKPSVVRRWKRARLRFGMFRIRFTHTIELLSKILGGLSVAAAIMCIVASILLLGVDHSPSDLSVLRTLLRGAQGMFVVNVLFHLVFDFHNTYSKARFFKWVADIAILLTALPLIYPHPEHPWIQWLERILYNQSITLSVVGIYALMELCYAIVSSLTRRINPSYMLAASFIFFIIIGSFLLMMPRCTVDGISYIDSLFVSTSAVCITGLTTVDVSATFTPFGLLILSLLIQIGGLGVMTFTSFFALFFSGNTSVYSQLVVKDMIYSKTINSLLPTLLYILLFTLTIEAVGALAIFLCVHGTLSMNVEDEIIFSAFHSLSGFCNAGFSNIEGGLSNPALLHSNQMVYIVASLLIFAGGIGFPILVNIKSAAARHLHNLGKRLRGRARGETPVHLYDMNTKIVITTTLIIFGVSSALFFVFEYDNSLAGMSLYDKVVQSVFNSFVPRSSGFSSVSPAGFLNITIIMMIVLMWIGGGSQSTAGGIKVNTLAVILQELRALIRGRVNVVVYNRTISVDSIRRANGVVVISIITYVAVSMLLVAFEPDMSVKALLYESASALFTVGSSLGITPELSSASKILLCIAMFTGRVGILSLLIGIFGTRSEPPVRHPSDIVIIN